MRIIPKSAKVRTTFFKNFTIVDLVIGLVILALVSLTVLSNLYIKWVLGVVEIFILVLLYMDFEGERGYKLIVNLFAHLFSRKKFRDKDIAKFIPFTNIVGEHIHYAGEYYSGVIEIEPLEFRLLDEIRQDTLINVFSFVTNNIGADEFCQLIKLDRPLLLDSFVERVRAKQKELKADKSYTAEERKARLEVLADREATLTALNGEERIYISRYYVAFYSANKSQLDKSILQVVNNLTNGGLVATRLNEKELVKFAKYNYSLDFDEREVDSLEPDKYMSYILPKAIEVKAKSVDIDGMPQRTYAIYDYPLSVSNAWGAGIMDIPNTRVVVNMRGIERSKAERMIDSSLMEIGAKLESVGKASKVIELQTHYESLALLLEGLNNDREELVSTSIYITHFEDATSSVDRQTVRKIVKGYGFRVTDLFCNQCKGYISCNLSSLELNKRLAVGINSSTLAAIFPFVTNRIMDKNGVLIGENGVPIILDFFKRNKIYHSGNIVIIGSSGSGKSYAVKSLLVQLLADMVRVFIYDPDNEYTRLASSMGGQVIDLSKGERSRINPLEILLGSELEEQPNPVVNHLYFLEEFYKVIFPDLSAVSLEELNRITAKVYNDFGIVNDRVAQLTSSDFPTFDHIYAEIIARLASPDERTSPSLNELELNVSKLASGGRFSNLWCGASNLTMEAKLVVFNFQSLLANTNKILASAQMLLLTRFLNNEIINNYLRYKHLGDENMPKILVAIDEAHVFIDKNNPAALRFMKKNSKMIRKYGGAQAVITQSIADFVANEEVAAETKAVITESQYSLFFRLNAANLNDLLELYRGLSLNDEEIKDIISNDRGTAFMIASAFNRSNINVVSSEVVASKFEHKS